VKKEDDDFMVDDDDFEFDEGLMAEIETSTPAKQASTNGAQKEKETVKATIVKKENERTTPVKVVKVEVKSPPAKRKVEVESSDEDDFVDPKPAPKVMRATPKKEKPAPKEVKAEVTTVKKEAAAKKTPTKPTPKPPKKPDSKIAEEDTKRKAILKNIETVALPSADPPSDTKYIPQTTNPDSITAQWRIVQVHKP
jgi:hypothetical protein